MSAPQFIGDALIAAGLLTAAQRDEALKLQRRWGSRFGEVVQAKGWVRAFDFYVVLAAQLGVPFKNLMQEPPAPELFETRHMDSYAQHLLLPWRRDADGIVLACADPGKNAQAWAAATYGTQVRWVVTSKFDIQWQMQALGSSLLTERALNALADRAPVHSARRTFTGAQLLAAHLGLSALILGLALAPIATLTLFNALLLVFLLAILGLKILLAWYGSSSRIDIKVTADDVARLHEPSLPVYTVLVPMYKEPDVLPILANALRQLRLSAVQARYQAGARSRRSRHHRCREGARSRVDLRDRARAGERAAHQAEGLQLRAGVCTRRAPHDLRRGGQAGARSAQESRRGLPFLTRERRLHPGPAQLLQRRGELAHAHVHARVHAVVRLLPAGARAPAYSRFRSGGTSNHFRIDVLRAPGRLGPVQRDRGCRPRRAPHAGRVIASVW